MRRRDEELERLEWELRKLRQTHSRLCLELEQLIIARDRRNGKETMTAKALTIQLPKSRGRILLRATGTVLLTQPVDFVCSPTVQGRRRPVRGSTKEACARCGVMLWMAPSARKVTDAPAICLDCAQKMAKGEGSV